MDVVVERCAGLDVHRDNVVATVRVPSEDQHRYDRQTRTFKGDARRARAAACLARGLCGDAGRDGGHGRLLDDRVSGA